MARLPAGIIPNRMPDVQTPTGSRTAPPSTGLPFEQGRFEELPLRPRVPRPYFEADVDHLTLDSAPFGRIRVRVVSYGPRDAPPLLLIHGLMTSSYSWRYMSSGSAIATG